MADQEVVGEDLMVDILADNPVVAMAGDMETVDMDTKTQTDVDMESQTDEDMTADANGITSGLRDDRKMAQDADVLSVQHLKDQLEKNQNTLCCAVVKTTKLGCTILAYG